MYLTVPIFLLNKKAKRNNSRKRTMNHQMQTRYKQNYNIILKKIIQRYLNKKRNINRKKSLLNNIYKKPKYFDSADYFMNVEQ